MSEFKVRQDWIRACQFVNQTEKAVLEQVVSHAQELGSQGVVLLDLDSTLYEVGSRTLQILKEWADSSESKAYPEIRSKASNMVLSQMGYSMKDTFANGLALPIQDSEVKGALDSAKKFWVKRFFTSEYLKYDHAYKGAPEFVQTLYKTGAEIIYLTGRDEPGMGEGTRTMLKRDGFPFGVERTHLLLKAAFHLDDLEHKTAASKYVEQKGKLIASFENEPPNLIGLSEVFPEAMHVFVDTIYSDRPALVKNGLYKIKNFESWLK
jgi:hypothetical protein